MMEVFNKAVAKVKQFVDWIDSVPSLPAFGVGVLLGLIVPKTVWIAIALVGVVYLVVKFSNTGESNT